MVAAGTRKTTAQLAQARTTAAAAAAARACQPARWRLSFSAGYL